MECARGERLAAIAGQLASVVAMLVQEEETLAAAYASSALFALPLDPEYRSKLAKELRPEDSGAHEAGDH